MTFNFRESFAIRRFRIQSLDWPSAESDLWKATRGIRVEIEKYICFHHKLKTSSFYVVR